MPITRKKFLKGDFDRAFLKREAHPVAIFLRKNYSYAFKFSEIIHKTKMNKNTVRGALRTLKKKGLIIHKSPYFAWKK